MRQLDVWTTTLFFKKMINFNLHALGVSLSFMQIQHFFSQRVSVAHFSKHYFYTSPKIWDKTLHQYSRIALQDYRPPLLWKWKSWNSSNSSTKSTIHHQVCTKAKGCIIIFFFCFSFLCFYWIVVFGLFSYSKLIKGWFGKALDKKVSVIW